MKTLIINANPRYQESSTNKFLQMASQWLGDQVQWVQLDEQINSLELSDAMITDFQHQLLAADKIIFQFPMYWYSAPASLKVYIDQVITTNLNLKDKVLATVMTIGNNLDDYQAGGSEKYSISEILKPYQALANKLQMKYIKPFVIDRFAYMEEQQKMQLIVEYLMLLSNLEPLSFSQKQQWFLKQLNNLSLKDDTKKDRLAVLIDQVDLNFNELDDLKANLQMIKDEGA